MTGNMSQIFATAPSGKKAANGFSLIELLIVVVLLFIFAAISVPYIYNYRRAYRSEDQSLKVMDLMREASQLALNQRRTVRFELDLTDNVMLLVDERTGVAGQLIKSIPLESTRELRIDVNPTGITAPNPPNYPNGAFVTDTLGHLVGTNNISGHSVWAARFRSDGSVVNGANAPQTATLFCWPPSSTGSAVTRRSVEVRAITIFGGSGAVRYWKYNGTTFLPF